MPSTTGYSFGDVVLVPFPFTDHSAIKRRPAVVISSQGYNRARRDVIIMAVTSQLRPGHSTDLQVVDWKAAGLLKPSVIKPIITTIQQSLIMRRLGRLRDVDQLALKRTISTVIGE